MGRPKLNDAEKKEKRVTVRFRSEEINGLSEQAGLCGLSVSELVYRRACAQTDLLFSGPVLSQSMTPIILFLALPPGFAGGDGDSCVLHLSSAMDIDKIIST